MQTRTNGRQRVDNVYSRGQQNFTTLSGAGNSFG